MAHAYEWWQTGVVYQIYPRSFMDSNGDGVGDLVGINQRLDYLKWLGIDAIWLSPIYPSPMADFGYDIANYTDIEPLFGTLNDFDALLHKVHQQNMKLILDFVPNHTSDEHPWFVESRSSRESSKRDWYIWHDPAADGGPPNNWTSFFGGSAWQFDEISGQYYLHMFDVKQPDLNWRNPVVKEAMYNVLRFWLDRGVDGFRVDVIWMMIKDAQFRDNPNRPEWKPGDPPYARQEGRYTEDQSEVHEIIREMRALVDSYGERVFIGEIYLPVPRLMSYYGEFLDEVHLPFNFQFIELSAWNAKAIRTCVDTYEKALPEGAWPNWVLGNHDRSRIASRVGKEQSRIAQMLLLTLRGTPTCYYGDELGMQNAIVPHEMMHDPQGKDNPIHSRDPQRSPMQWNSQPGAGFVKPGIASWLPLSEDYQQVNVQSEQNDASSHLIFTKTLLTLRRAIPALTIGSYTSVDGMPEECFVYVREQEGKRYLIALNCSAEEQKLSLAHIKQGNILLSTLLDRNSQVDLNSFSLRANEGCLIEIAD
ncbi:alpha-amylase family glycosyl hydrolase [Dictyobacter kobayashii]|uniref:Alpha-amylase n=1 Tax=Dictyobacter kobayashii TaxID=2014872 RepID=A0A402AB87_9CHLR|nr:alpha-amylase family glycosyl hydrolase [Dictyobacter kobayashii]GCE16235.1 alpha-amylase [Dictyobacter kobayashii]